MSETENAVQDNVFEQKFSNSNHFIAREQAFSYALNYKDNFFDANRGETEHFFEHNDGIYTDFVITVIFLNPNNSEEIVIDNFEPFYLEGLTERIEENPVRLEQTLNALIQELEVIKKNNVSINNNTKTIKVFYSASNETKHIEIIPTEYLNVDAIKIHYNW